MDATILHGILAGLVVAIAAIWGSYVINRLWQEHLVEAAAGALDEAGRLGLRVLEPRFGPCQVATGSLAGRALRLEWRGGVWGEHTVLVADGRVSVLPLLRGAEELRRALDVEEIRPEA